MSARAFLSPLQMPDASAVLTLVATTIDQTLALRGESITRGQASLRRDLREAAASAAHAFVA